MPTGMSALLVVRRWPRGCLLLAAFLAGPVRAEVGSGVSGLFTVDTRYGFSLGSGVSGFFTVDTRHSGMVGRGLLLVVYGGYARRDNGRRFWGYRTIHGGYALRVQPGVGSVELTVDTRLSGWSGDGFSPLFTLDTRLPLLMLEKTGTNFILSWFAAAPGYQLEVSSNLASPNWSPVTNCPRPFRAATIRDESLHRPESVLPVEKELTAGPITSAISTKAQDLVPTGAVNLA